MEGQTATTTQKNLINIVEPNECLQCGFIYISVYMICINIFHNNIYSFITNIAPNTKLYHLENYCLVIKV